MTNFDFLKKYEQFNSFADLAITAERLIATDPTSSLVVSRKTLEFIVKWMYSVDESLILPYKDNLNSLMRTDEFIDIVDRDILVKMHYIRNAGNEAAHKNINFKKEKAIFCLDQLFSVVDFVVYCYGTEYVERRFDKDLLDLPSYEEISSGYEELQINLKELLKENEKLKKELTSNRKNNEENYEVKPSSFSEAETRKHYIDTMLVEAGWRENSNWINEVKVEIPSNSSGFGYVDYVLYDDRQVPLAIVEAKKKDDSIAKARYQSKEYADALEKKYGRRPIVFITNGYDTRIIDGRYPERKVASIYSKNDLEKLFNLRSRMLDLKDVNVNLDIAGRYYQIQAIKAVCEAFEKNKRKALLVMATGERVIIVTGCINALRSRVSGTLVNMIHALLRVIKV